MQAMNWMNIVPLTLFAILVFPGLLFLSALAMFTEWYVRKLVARMQNRMGPAYVGPFGLLQPLADFIKLVFVKEEKRQRYASPSMAKLGLALGIGGMVSVMLMLPISPLRLAAPYDVIVLAYAYVVWATLGMIIAGLSFPNPFTVAGTSRYIAMALVVEPAWLAALFVPITLTTALMRGNGVPFSVLYTAENAWRLWLNPLYIIPMILSLVAIMVATQAKVMFKPFDIPEAEQELIAGPITEFSGPVLALYNFFHDLEITVCAIIITYIFLGGPYPFPHSSPIGVALLVIKYLAVVAVLTMIRSSMGRFRIEQGIATVVKYSLVPAVIGLVIATTLLLFAG